MNHASKPTHTSNPVTLSARPPCLTDAERQPCEIWTRVMGYHRPVSSFNIGKKGEFHERTCFTERSAALEG
jgi:hypothetical protein